MLRIFRGERRADAAAQQAQREQRADAPTETNLDRQAADGPQTSGNGRSAIQAQGPPEPAGDASTAAPDQERPPEPAGDASTAAPDQERPPEPEAGSTPSAEPGFLERGRMRRRARFLRAARELAYRDLGGLVFDLNRFGVRNDEVVQAKLDTLARIDSELRLLEEALRERRSVSVLREAGVAACPRCAAIHGSGDRFCPTCGLAVNQAERPIAGPSPAPQSAAAPAQAAAPSAAVSPRAPHPNGVHAALPAAPARSAGAGPEAPTEVIPRGGPHQGQPQRTVAFDSLSPLAGQPAEGERAQEQRRP